jgi:hypothetical protein
MHVMASSVRRSFIAASPRVMANLFPAAVETARRMPRIAWLGVAERVSRGRHVALG